MMLISFTKDVAKLFDLDLEISRSEKLAITPPLDDWVMACLWNRKEHVGLSLIHKHSLFSMLVVSEVKVLSYCLDLFYDQLIALLTEAGLKDDKYSFYLDDLFQEIHAVKHDDKRISGAMRFVYENLALSETIATKNKSKLHSIDVSRMINESHRDKLNGKSSSEIFFDLIKTRCNDQILTTYPDKKDMPTLH